jgi:hypothetical protein
MPEQCVNKYPNKQNDICWTHKVAGIADPCKSNLVMSMKEWTPRSIGRFTIRKEPITPDIIKNTVAIYGKARADLTQAL